MVDRYSALRIIARSVLLHGRLPRMADCQPALGCTVLTRQARRAVDDLLAHQDHPALPAVEKNASAVRGVTRRASK
jgi:hypothetical protein